MGSQGFRLRPPSARSIGVAGALAVLLAGGFAAADPATAPLRIDEIFAREPLIGRLPASITWAPDGSRFLYTLPAGDAGPLDTHLYDARAHRDRIFFRAAAEGKGARPAPEFVWSPDSRQLAYLDAGDLWIIGADGADRKRLAAGADDPQWSADSKRVASHGYAVSALAGVDEKRRVAFVAAAFPTRRDSTLLMIPLGGGEPRPLASGNGTHAFFLAPNARNFVRADSAFGMPPAYSIGSTLGGGLVPFIRSTPPAGRDLGSYELTQIDSTFGQLDAWMIKPPNFNPAKQYPVIMYVYGGPAAPTTGNSWDGQIYLFHRALAQRGFIVFSVDGPGSQIDSAAAVRRLHHRLGPASLAGQLAGVSYLQAQPYVDPERIGIWGWSFGGYETTYALTHAPGTWKVGVAVAPVTDWIYYDSVYTERYMGMPLQNSAAYRDSSVVAGAAGFAGRLLIAQGSSDDNVHLANSVSLLQALLLTGKHADFMVYPRETHGITGIPQRRHLFTHMLDYWQEHL